MEQDQGRGILRLALAAFVFVVFLLAGTLAMSWAGVSWGKVEFLPASTITVTGEAKENVKSQIASFSVGVTVYNDDKQKATDEVNTKVADIIKQIKAFGVAEEDIKTQSIIVNEDPGQVRIQTYPASDRLGRWMAQNTIEVKLRDVSKVSAFVDMLNKTGATNIYGPNFMLDDTTSTEEALLEAAVDDARSKAEKLARASGRRLGKVITVSETGAGPIYPVALEARGAGGGAPTPVEPGSQTVYKSVTVVFELR